MKSPFSDRKGHRGSDAFYSLERLQRTVKQIVDVVARRFEPIVVDREQISEEVYEQPASFPVFTICRAVYRNVVAVPRPQSMSFSNILRSGFLTGL